MVVGSSGSGRIDAAALEFLPPWLVLFATLAFLVSIRHTFLCSAVMVALNSIVCLWRGVLEVVMFDANLFIDNSQRNLVHDFGASRDEAMRSRNREIGETNGIVVPTESSLIDNRSPPK